MTTNLRETYQETLNKLNAFQLALTTVSYDDQTIAPKDGRDYRGTMLSILSGEYFEILQSESFFTILENLDKTPDLDEITAASVRYFLKEIKKTKNVPLKEYIDFNKLMSDSNNIWEESRSSNDFARFEPMLQKVIDALKKMISYRNDGLSLYDSLLDDYEEGLTTEKVNEFFAVLQERLVPFLKRITALNRTKPAFLSREITDEKQQQITDLLLRYLNFESRFGQQSLSEHPFSTNMSINDVRVTTHFYPKNFTSNIFSIIHEVGHATYNHQVNPAFEGTPLANNMSYSMHESQSRLMENMLGRTPSFWYSLYPQLVTIIPEILGDVSFDDFIFGINYVEPSLIRTEADELTYPLHILIRYNLEQKIFASTDPVSDLNTLWADEYEAILGVRPDREKEGILQDVHWSQASFGYFPTYALGSAYAAQFMETMRDQIDVNGLLKSGDFKQITEWLRFNIHQYSGTIQAKDLILKVTGKPFDATIYCDYLIEKYAALYQL